MTDRGREAIIVFLVAAAIMAGILFGTGTIFSGWHLVDDHETVRLAELNVKEGNGFFATLKETVIGDMKYRWRPLYWVFRVAGAYLFKQNSVIPNSLLCLLGIFTYVFLYYGMKNIVDNMIYAHLFSCIVVLGRQFEMWYRISNQENLGLFFLAVCLWAVTKQYRDNAYNNKSYDILLTISALACAMMKESFLILLPGIILFRLGLEIFCNNTKATVVVKRHWLMCVLIAGTFLFSMAVILGRVGTDFGGYAGVDVDSGIKGIIWQLLRMCNNSLKVYLIIAVICCGIFVFSWKNFLKLTKNEIKITAVFLIFSLYIIAGEMILYAKSDMWDRYLVPFTIGYGLFLIILAGKLLTNRYMIIIYLLVLTVFLGTRLYLSAATRAADYAGEGREIQNILSYIAENTGPDARIVTALGEGERDMAFSIYLEFADRKNVYMYEENADIWQDVYQVYGNTEELKAGDKCDIYILEGRKENHDMEEKYFSAPEWEKITFGKWFDVWVNTTGKADK